MLMQPDVKQAEAEDDEIDLVALLATLWSGKVWIAGGSALAMAAAAAYLIVTPPTYQADALLQLEAGKNMLALPSSMSELLGSNEPSTMAELEILRSRQVLGRAVAELNLAWIAEPDLWPVVGPAVLRLSDPESRPSIALSYLEVHPDWMDKAMVLTKTGETSFEIVLPDGGLLGGEIGELVSNAATGFAINLHELRGKVGQTYMVVHRSELAAIRLLSAAVSAAERGRQSGILELTLKNGNRTAARDQLNAVVRAYTEQNISKSSAEAQKSLDFVNSQLPVAQKSLAAAEAELNAYRAAQQSVDLEFETQSLLTETMGIEGQLRALKLKEEELKQKYTPNHPVYRQLVEERDVLLQRFDELQSGITDLPETQREVVNLARNLELAQAAYFELMNRSQELRVLSASQIGSVRVIDDAEAQVVPVAPKKKQIMGLALLLGLVGGAATVLIRSWLRRGINSVQEIERIGVPVFATVNLYESRAGAAPAAPLVAKSEPEHIVVEALRSLRTSLHFGMLDGNNKSLVLTSSAPGAGKSFIAANLAVVAAQAGQRVCLVDADMRRGTLRKYFGLEKGLAGLSGFLVGKQDIADVLRQSDTANLSLIMTGPIPPNPSELLMRPRLQDLIEGLDRDFDLIIFDAPPVLAVTDAVIIGRSVGSVISVVRHDVTPIGEVASVRSTLDAAGVALKGTIFNAFDPRRAGTSRGYGYGYGYRYSYSRDKT